MPYIVGTLKQTTLSLTGGAVESGVTTTTSTDEAAILSVSATEYQSVEFKIQVIDSSTVNSTIVRAMHDGTNAYVSEYGTLQVAAGIATFSADVNAGSLRLLAYPSSSGLTTFNVVYTALNA